MQLEIICWRHFHLLVFRMFGVLDFFRVFSATVKVSCFHIEVALPCMVRDILHDTRVHSAWIDVNILNENVSGIYSRI